MSSSSRPAATLLHGVIRIPSPAPEAGGKRPDPCAYTDTRAATPAEKKAIAKTKHQLRTLPLSIGCSSLPPADASAGGTRFTSFKVRVRRVWLMIRNEEAGGKRRFGRRARMPARTRGAVVWGAEARPVEIESDIQRGLPAFHIVGLPDAAIRESRERIRSALKNSGFEFPLGRITINLAPAVIRKGGSSLDLPMAVGVLAASGQIPPPPASTLYVGELGLDGTLRSVRGLAALLTGIEAMSGGEDAPSGIVFPAAQREEGEALLERLRWKPAGSLKEALREEGWRSPEGGGGRMTASAGRQAAAEWMKREAARLWHGIRGQETALKAALIAAAGRHHVLFEGPPGIGKSMCARLVHLLLPPLGVREARRCAAIKSCGRMDGERERTGGGPGLDFVPPLRAPHSSATTAGLCGGGLPPAPGEVTLAHHGVLLLDEIREFDTRVLEALRTPLEEGVINLSRGARSWRLPADFLLVATSNPCPCGRHGEDDCTCTPAEVRRYRNRISRPLLERIDIKLRMHPPRYLPGAPSPGAGAADDLRYDGFDRTYASIAAAVERQLARRRAGIQSSFNSRVTGSELERSGMLDRDALDTLERLTAGSGVSPRTVDKILKVALTMCDLAGEETIGSARIREAYLLVGG